jgi:carbon starvation protein
MFIAGVRGDADLAGSAPAVATQAPPGAPPIWPFLFITIACGAVSGFHCLVSSGTSSKQVANECDAQYVGYGAMLLEGALAVIVILACCAGVGMGKFTRQDDGSYVAAVDTAGSQLIGKAAWLSRYNPDRNWNAFGLGDKVGAFVEGGANFLAALGISLQLSIAIVAVLVACFAATTLDTATRLQRYVVQELAAEFRFAPLTNKYLATAFAVVLALTLALMRGPNLADGTLRPYGTGGLYLWPLFGAINQLLAGLALMVTVFYLARRNKPIWFALVPMLIMIVMPIWALGWQIFNAEAGWWPTRNYLLLTIGAAALLLQLWMVVEALLAWPRVRGVLEEALPPLPSRIDSGLLRTDSQLGGGRSC